MDHICYNVARRSVLAATTYDSTESMGAGGLQGGYAGFTAHDPPLNSAATVACRICRLLARTELISIIRHRASRSGIADRTTRLWMGWADARRRETRSRTAGGCNKSQVLRVSDIRLPQRQQVLTRRTRGTAGGRFCWPARLLAARQTPTRSNAGARRISTEPVPRRRVRPKKDARDDGALRAETSQKREQRPTRIVGYFVTRSVCGARRDCFVNTHARTWLDDSARVEQAGLAPPCGNPIGCEPRGAAFADVSVRSSSHTHWPNRYRPTLERATETLDIGGRQRFAAHS